MNEAEERGIAARVGGRRLPQRGAGVATGSCPHQNLKIQSMLQTQQSIGKVQAPECMRTEGLGFAQQQGDHLLERFMLFLVAACGHSHKTSLSRSGGVAGIRRQRGLFKPTLTFVKQVPEFPTVTL